MEQDIDRTSLKYLLWCYELGLRETAYILSNHSVWPMPAESIDRVTPRINFDIKIV